MRNWMTAWTLCMMVTGGAALSAQEGHVPLTVTIHVTDYAHLAPHDLASAQMQATDAYRAAGLHIVWSSVPWEPQAAQDTGSGSIAVQLVILPRVMAERKCRAERLDDSVMGVALTGARHAGGRVAYVFYDRIERAALSRQVPVVRGLAHVMAHEVGHVLLGVSSHAEKGLMQPNWNPRESRLQTFAVSQVETIRRRFTSAD